MNLAWAFLTGHRTESTSTTIRHLLRNPVTERSELASPARSCSSTYAVCTDTMHPRLLGGAQPPPMDRCSLCAISAPTRFTLSRWNCPDCALARFFCSNNTVSPRFITSERQLLVIPSDTLFGSF